jgi:hypothetical protein
LLIRTAASGRRVELNAADDMLKVVNAAGTEILSFNRVPFFDYNTEHNIDTGTKITQDPTVWWIAGTNTAYVAWIDSTNNDLYYSKTTNSGASWSAETSVYATCSTNYFPHSDRYIYAPTTSTVFIVFIDSDDDLRVAYTTNGGTNWSTQEIKDGISCSGCCMGGTDANNLFVIYQLNNAEIYITKTSTGVTGSWSTPVLIWDNNTSATSVISMSVVDTSNIYVIGYGSDSSRFIVYKTSNGGDNWSSMGETDLGAGSLGQVSIWATSTSEIWAMAYINSGTCRIYKSTGSSFSQSLNWSGAPGTGKGCSIWAPVSGRVRAVCVGVATNTELHFAYTNDGGSNLGTEKLIEPWETVDHLSIHGDAQSDNEFAIMGNGASSYHINYTVSIEDYVLHMHNPTNKPAVPTHGIHLYSKAGELLVKDAAGNETTLS